MGILVGDFSREAWKYLDKGDIIEKYKEWIWKTFNVCIDHGTERVYAKNVELMMSAIRENSIVTDIRENLNDWESEYIIKTKKTLLAVNGGEGNILILDDKSFDSFLIKTFVRNIKNNDRFPKPPKRGWICPDNWFQGDKINDIIRTLCVFKFLDGVKFVADKICALCNECSCEHALSYSSETDGYYAAHINMRIKVSIADEHRNGYKDIYSGFEIQLTTQMQEVLKQVLHRYYDANKIGMDPEDKSVRWDYKEKEFSLSHIGHMVHYIDGSIVNIND